MTLRLAAALAPILCLSTGCASVTRSAHDGDLAAVNAYLAQGGSVGTRFSDGGCDGCTLLHAAADGGQEPVVAALLDRGAEANAPDARGLTPLHFAAGGQSPAVVRLLLARGAAPSLAARDRWSNTPLLLAASTVKRTERWVHTPAGAVAVDEKATEPSADVIAALLDAGADVNAPTAKGNSPLHIAAYRGYAGTVKLLLSRGADRAAVNERGQTAEALAIAFRQDAVVAVLQAR